LAIFTNHSTFKSSAANAVHLSSLKTNNKIYSLQLPTHLVSVILLCIAHISANYMECSLTRKEY